jgi:hypothetical protein
MNAAKTLERMSSRLGYFPKPINPDHLIKKWNIARGDEVMIMAGKDKGEVGRVESVLKKQNKLIVVQKNLVIILLININLNILNKIYRLGNILERKLTAKVAKSKRKCPFITPMLCY